MASLPGVGVAARIELILALVLIATEARADPTDRAIIGDNPRWRIEDLQLRTSLFLQEGRGFQSQDGPAPGREDMFIVQPAMRMRVRQSAKVVHDVVIPIDAISAASPDAVDATTSASRNNIAGDLDIRTAITMSDHDTLTTRFIAHAEEWIGGGTIGLGWKRSLADDNATISINGTFGFDYFDSRDHFGTFLEKTGRATTSASLAGSQLLSPTTVVDASYGLTYQRGTLRTGWNSVPVGDGTLTDEVFPRDRTRHAWTAGIAQHIPQSRSTAKLRYRFYADDFGVRSHTVDAAAYQYLARWLYVRAAYRFHTQTSVDFFTRSLPMGFGDSTLRTADSDLAAFRAHEYGLQVLTLRDRGPLRRWSVSAEVFRYERSNDLTVLVMAIGAGRAL